mgnify:CR=1 FL=1
MSDAGHYKLLRGRLELEEVVKLIGDMHLSPAIRIGVIEYLVNGISMQETKGNTSKLVEVLHSINQRRNIGKSHEFMRDFICTNKYSPRGAA